MHPLLPSSSSPYLAIGSFGTSELIIVAVLALILGGIIGMIVYFIQRRK